MSRISPPLTTSMTGTGDRLAGAHDLLDAAPGALVLRALLGQDQAAFLVFLLQDEGFDLVADLHDLVRVDVVADRELLARDHALRLVADVQQDLVAVDLDDRAFHDVPVVEVTERLLHGDDRVLPASGRAQARRPFRWCLWEPTPSAHGARTEPACEIYRGAGAPRGSGMVGDQHKGRQRAVTSSVALRGRLRPVRAPADVGAQRARPVPPRSPSVPSRARPPPPRGPRRPRTPARRAP